MAGAVGGVDRRHRSARRLRGLQKSTGHYSATHAALGGRTLKTGQSRCLVGYKKHPLRFWLHDDRAGVLLVPLVSWATPANRSEGGLLVPSLHHCQRQWEWCPPLVVAEVRPWIEPAQSYEKNQLGLSQVFLNGLRLTGVMSLLADAVVILRARAIVGRPPVRPLLDALTPPQLSLELPGEDAPLV